MFYLLMVVGLGFILTGINLGKRNMIENIEPIIVEGPRDYEDIDILEKRVSELEKYLVDETNIDNNTVKIIDEDVSRDGFENFMLICKYEQDGYSLNDICKIMNIPKGEVLLLKNIYKDYLK